MMLLPLFAKPVDEAAATSGFRSIFVHFTVTDLQGALLSALCSLSPAGTLHGVLWHPSRGLRLLGVRFLTGAEEITPKGISLQRSWPEAEAAPNDRLPTLRARFLFNLGSFLREGPVPAGGSSVLAGPRSKSVVVPVKDRLILYSCI